MKWRNKRNAWFVYPVTKRTTNTYIPPVCVVHYDTPRSVRICCENKEIKVRLALKLACALFAVYCVLDMRADCREELCGRITHQHKTGRLNSIHTRTTKFRSECARSKVYVTKTARYLSSGGSSSSRGITQTLYLSSGKERAQTTCCCRIMWYEKNKNFLPVHADLW